MESEYKALVVDDEDAVRTLLVRSLTQERFCCDAAQDGLQAREMLDRHSYDVVVTDLRMPRQDGHVLATDLLATNDRPSVIVLTGLVERQLAKELLNRGVDDIAFKPVDYEIFALKVRQIVKRSRRSPNKHNGGDLHAQAERKKPSWLSRIARFRSAADNARGPMTPPRATGLITLEGLRDRAILSLALQAGLSAAEIAALNVCDIQIHQACEVVRIDRGEGAQVYTRLGLETAQGVRDYLQAADHSEDPQNALFQPLRVPEQSEHCPHRLAPSEVERILITYVGSLRLTGED